jgi:hypothetical protein
MASTISIPLEVDRPAAPDKSRSLLFERSTFTVVILSVTVFSRFGINFGSYSLNFSLVVIYALLVASSWCGRLAIAPLRFILFCVCILVGVTSFVLNTNLTLVDHASWTSLLLLATIYLPVVFVLLPEESEQSEWLWSMEMFSNVAVLCACAGIVQFYAQLVVQADWLFDFRPHLPTLLQGPAGYNTIIPVGALYKSNGFFFLEPSLFSFIMALALIVEMALRKRAMRIVLFALALLLSYSGTGLLALIVGLMFPLGGRTFVRLALLCGAVLVVYFLVGDVLNLSFTLDRVGEFGSEGSSGYIRYVAPMHLVLESIDANPWSALFGHGPGTITRTHQGFDFHDPTWAKLLFEYGLLGFAATVALVVTVLSQAVTPLQVRAALFGCWLAMGGYLLNPDHMALMLVLVGFQPLLRTVEECGSRSSSLSSGTDATAIMRCESA